MGDESLDDAWSGALDGQASAETGDSGPSGDDWSAAMTKGDAGGGAQASGDDPGGGGSAADGESQNFDFLLDIPLELKVELGHTDMIINKMLQLTQGSVVELNKAAGESVAIYVNDKLLGKGEVIVVNERFGVRITEIISQADRIKNMG